MNVMRKRWIYAGLGVAALTLLNACAVEGVGVGTSVGVGYVGGNYDGGYYEPYGYDYGGWGPGYRVGPGRGGDRRDAHRPHSSYRPAPPPRRTPTIPNRPRGHH